MKIPIKIILLNVIIYQMEQIFYVLYVTYVHMFICSLGLLIILTNVFTFLSFMSLKFFFPDRSFIHPSINSLASLNSVLLVFFIALLHSSQNPTVFLPTHSSLPTCFQPHCGLIHTATLLRIPCTTVDKSQ